MAKHPNLAALNIARRGQRRAPILWLLLAMTGVICITGAYSIWQAIQHRRDVNVLVQSQRDAKVRREAELRKTRIESRLPENLDRERDLRRIKEMAGLSWEGLFEALEISANRVRGGVSLVSMVPSAVKASMGQVHIAALASNTGVMLFYIEELKKDRRITRVELGQQHPEDKSAAGVVRFQLEVIWDPSIELPPSNKPVPLQAMGAVRK